MKKGINKEYDKVKNRLFELKLQVMLIQDDSTKKEELEQLKNEVNICLGTLIELEKDEINMRKHKER